MKLIYKTITTMFQQTAQIGRGAATQTSGQSREIATSFFAFEAELRRIVIVSLLLLVPILSQAQKMPADTSQLDSGTQLERYLQQAAQNNPDLKSAYHQYLASLEEIPQVGALPDPELSFGYFVNPIETRVGPQQARFSVSQMLPWFGTLGARKDVKTLQAKARFQQFQNMRNQLFYDIKSVWYDLYVLEQKIEILEENIRLMETLEELTLQQYETAEGNQTDVLQVQIEIEDLRINHSKLIDDRKVLRQTFIELLNRDTVEFPEQIELKAPELSAEPAELEQQMLTRNPEINQLTTQEQAARESIRAAKLNGLPKIGVGMEYILTGQRDMALIDNGQDAFLARASIQIPLWRTKYRAEKQQAELQYSSVREQHISKENQLATKFEKAMRDFRDARRRLNLYEEKQIDRTRQAIDILLEQYTTATSDFEEILRLHRRLLTYQQSREEAIGNQHKAAARIELLTGHYNIETD